MGYRVPVASLLLLAINWSVKWRRGRAKFPSPRYLYLTAVRGIEAVYCARMDM